ncbi:putative deoxyribonuclease TATDN1 [Grifola frondosa]|uniref:Putative deoxyribonuclease TATDN1 n=1 Tax=Grifola frondosa TaxID=5627 RepID=A0A1C7MQ04_GRIFR|nr:putative deoxyribonuclease TATDN1 [Grifola frondosa]
MDRRLECWQSVPRTPMSADEHTIRGTENQDQDQIEEHVPVTVVPAKPTQEVPKGNFRFIDVAVNLTDPVFRGYRRAIKAHEDDMDAMLERSRAAGVKSMIITGGSLHESREALELARQLGFYATVGCHPTRSAQFDGFKGGPEAYLAELDKLITANLSGKGRVVAVGECGLGVAYNYDRTHFASEEVQRTHFRSQLALAKKHHLPLFLHSRAAHTDFVKILREEGFGKNGGRDVGAKGGIVHSFTGTAEEVVELMGMGFHIGVNGCSLKTESNLTAAKAIRPEAIMFETDSPWCSFTSNHASKSHLSSLPPSLSQLYFPPSAKTYIPGKAIKGRNEPTTIGGVAWVIHRLNEGIPYERVTERAWKNTIQLFGLNELIEE